MPDRDTLINTLTLCLGEGIEKPDPCNYCAYSAKLHCVREMMRDAFALLKEQDTVEYALDVLKKHGWKDDSEVTGDAADRV